MNVKVNHLMKMLLSCVLLLLTSAPAIAAPAPFPDVIALPNGWQPEGITTGNGHTAYVGSLRTGAIYQVDLRTGEGAIAVPPQVGRIAVGLDYDERTSYIFAAGGPGGAGYVYDATTGAAVSSFQFATTSTFVNDVIITTKAAYFTDSARALIYKVDLDSGGQVPTDGSFTTIPLSGDFVLQPGFNANGIEATANGKALILVHSGRGELYNVDPTTGNAKLIDLAGASVRNGDGLLLDGKTLYVMQNQLNQIAVVQLNPQLTAGVITELLTDDDFDVPATIAGFGNSIYAVNARFTTSPTPDTSYAIVRVAK